MYETCAPGEVVEVVEGLWREGLLTRRDATTLEEKIFEVIGPTGRWGR